MLLGHRATASLSQANATVSYNVKTTANAAYVSHNRFDSSFDLEKSWNAEVGADALGHIFLRFHEGKQRVATCKILAVCGIQLIQALSLIF